MPTLLALLGLDKLLRLDLAGLPARAGYAYVHRNTQDRSWCREWGLESGLGEDWRRGRTEVKGETRKYQRN